MNKIASPRDLQHELHALLVYAQTKQPSRARIAEALNDLADRVVVGGEHTAFPKVKGPAYWATYKATPYKEVTKRFKTRALAMQHAQKAADSLGVTVSVMAEHDRTPTIVEPKSKTAVRDGS